MTETQTAQQSCNGEGEGESTASMLCTNKPISNDSFAL